MRMFSVADQRSIPEIDIDTLIAVPCREVLLTEDVRGRAAVLAAEHPVLENGVPGSIPEMLAKLAEGVPVDGMEALLPLLRPDRSGAALRSPSCRHPAAGLRSGEGPDPRRRPDQVRPRVPRGVVVERGGRRGRARSTSRRWARPGSSGSTTPAMPRAPPVTPGGRLSQLDDGSAVDARHPACTVGARASNTASKRSSRCCVPTSPPGVTRWSSPRAPARRMRVVEQLAEADTPATMLEPGAAPQRRRGRRAQGPAARRGGDAWRRPGRHHRDRPHRQPGHRRRWQAVGRQASQRRRPARTDRRRPRRARPARHRPVRRDDRARSSAAPAASTWCSSTARPSAAADRTSSTCRWTRWTSCRATSAVRRRR